MSLAWNVPISLDSQLKSARQQQKDNRRVVISKKKDGKIVLSRSNGSKLSVRARARALKELKQEEEVRSAAEAFLSLAQTKPSTAGEPDEHASGACSPRSELSDASTAALLAADAARAEPMGDYCPEAQADAAQ